MNKKQLGQLFLSTLYLSAFTFGGGYVIVTLMQKKFVNEYHWIDQDEMLDLVAIAQSSPGAIAVNGAVAIGYKLTGITGVLISVLATIIPPFIIMSIVSLCYDFFRTNWFIACMLEGMQAGVAAVIASVTYEMACGVIKERSWLYNSIMIIAFIASFCFDINVVYIIVICILLGLIKGWREKA